jgi:hemerythrin-like domain-containing protein
MNYRLPISEFDYTLPFKHIISLRATLRQKLAQSLAGRSGQMNTSATRLDRRLVLQAAAGGILLPAGAPRLGQASERHAAATEVSATEDMMREHGVLRRALLIYAETVPRLRADASAIEAKALNDTAKLFRAFGEDYHERKLEEPHVFPAVRGAGGPAAALPDVLIVQHNRGREITDYVLAVTGKGAIKTGDAEPLASALESLDLMYQNHAAREDTVIFPAWKTILSTRQMKEMSEKFEEIEHQLFGEDGFEDAVRKVATIEDALGYANIAQFTAPSLPSP